MNVENNGSAAIAEANGGGSGIRALLSDLQVGMLTPIVLPEAVGATSTAAGLAAPAPAPTLNDGSRSIGGIGSAALAAAMETKEGEEEQEHPFLASLCRQVAAAEASSLASVAGDARRLAAAAEGRALLRRLSGKTTTRSRSESEGGCSGQQDLLTVESLNVRESTSSQGRQRRRQTKWRLEAKVSSLLSSSAAGSVVDLSRSRLIVAPSGGGTEARELTATTRVKVIAGDESGAGRTSSSSSSVLLSATVLLAASDSRAEPSDAPSSLWVWVTAPLLEEKEKEGGGRTAAGITVVAAGRAELLRSSDDPAAAAAAAAAKAGGKRGRPPAPASSSDSSDSGSEDEGERAEGQAEEAERNRSGLRETKRSLSRASSARRLAAAASALASEVDAATLAVERALLLARGSRSGNANESDGGENAVATATEAWHAARDAAALTDATVEEALR